MGIIAHSVLLKDAKNIHILYTARKEDAHEGNSNEKKVSYAKWGYLFILPFFLVFLVFQLVPLVSTFYYSFSNITETDLP